jgi:hypothetical protein
LHGKSVRHPVSAIDFSETSIFALFACTGRERPLGRKNPVRKMVTDRRSVAFFAFADNEIQD